MTEQRIANRFMQKFYGQDTWNWNGQCTFHRKGFPESIPHGKVMGRVIIIVPEGPEKVLKFFRGYSAEIYVREMAL